MFLTGPDWDTTAGVRCPRPERVVAVLGLTALFTESCRDRSSAVTYQDAATSAEPVTGHARTRVAARDHGFSLLLPAGWTQQARTAAGPDVYRPADGSAQITVSAFPASPRMDAARRDETLTALLEDRRKADRSAMGARMTEGEPRRTVRSAVVSARYEGLDVDAGHRFATLLVVSAAGAWAFLVESRETDEDTFSRLEETVFDGVDVDQ